MRIAFCADIHIGASNTNLQELMSCFEQMVTQSDMIVIGGDILDAKYHTSSENITILLDMMDYIMPMISSSKKILRLIYGTQSHDGYPQLQILEPYTRMMNFKIIHHVSEEMIGKTSFLYIPEEIISSKKEYYADTLYSGKKYDYIFGHGVIAEGMPMVRESKVKKIRSVPIFKAGELSEACKFQCCFGHYHRNFSIGNVHYVGSITRFQHGEPEEKGWYQIDGRDIQFVVNQWCPKYIEYRVTCSRYTPDDMQIMLSNRISEFNNMSMSRDKLKFTFFLDRRSENATNYTNIIRTLCRGDGISYAIKDINEVTLQDDTISDKYDYILDPNIPIVDKINRYNESEFDGELDQELLVGYLQKIKHSE